MGSVMEVMYVMEVMDVRRAMQVFACDFSGFDHAHRATHRSMGDERMEK
jgi:hypothetical protein